VRRLPSGRWQARRFENGTLRSVGTFATKRDAERALVLAEAEALRDARPLDAEGTVAEWYEKWLDGGAKRWRGRTVAHYRATARVHVLPRWGTVAIGDVRRADVLAWVGELGKAGVGDSLLHHTVGILQRILHHAVECEALDVSPIDRLRLPSPKPATVRPLTIEQVEVLADAIEWPKFAPGGHGAQIPAQRQHRSDLALWVRLGAYCGLRAGEVLALRRESVDLERNVLIVAGSVSDVEGRLTLGPTKTGRVRAVPIPEPLVKSLADHLERWVGPEPDALVFTSEAGGLVSHANWRRRHFRPAVRRAGLPESLRYHDLRHTYASLLIAEGAHPRAIMERLGHSSIQVTLGTYGHLFPTLDEALTGRLGERIRAVQQGTFGTDLARNEQRREAGPKETV